MVEVSEQEVAVAIGVVRPMRTTVVVAVDRVGYLLRMSMVAVRHIRMVSILGRATL